MSSTPSYQIPIIHSMRGVAALAVCLYHFVYSPEGFIENESVRGIFNYGQKGVEVFFIISAVVIPISLLKFEYTIRKAPLFIWKRLVRVEPPYLVAVATGIAYLVIRNYIPGSADVDLTPSAKEIILHLGYLVPFFEDARWINPVFWTLAIEFQYYLYIALVFPLVLRKKILLRILFHALIIAPVFFAPDHKNFLYWSSYFGLGIYYVLWKFKKIGLIEFWIMIGACSASIFIWQGPINLLIGGATLAVIHFWPKPNPKLGRGLGNISYSLYLLHNIIGAAFLNYFVPKVDGIWIKIGLILVTIAISIFSAYVLWRLVEKPFQAISRRVGQRKEEA